MLTIRMQCGPVFSDEKGASGPLAAAASVLGAASRRGLVWARCGSTLVPFDAGTIGALLSSERSVPRGRAPHGRPTSSRCAPRPRAPGKSESSSSTSAQALSSVQHQASSVSVSLDEEFFDTGADAVLRMVDACLDALSPDSVLVGPRDWLRELGAGWATFARQTPARPAPRRRRRGRRAVAARSSSPTAKIPASESPAARDPARRAKRCNPSAAAARRAAPGPALSAAPCSAGGDPAGDRDGTADVPRGRVVPGSARVHRDRPRPTSGRTAPAPDAPTWACLPFVTGAPGAPSPRARRPPALPVSPRVALCAPRPTPRSPARPCPAVHLERRRCSLAARRHGDGGRRAARTGAALRRERGP